MAHQATAWAAPAALYPAGVEMEWKSTLPSGADGPAKQVPDRRVTRADFLISDLALRRPDGTWLESRKWQACFRADQGRNRALLEGVPGMIYTGIRFKVGLEAALDRSDPNQWPAGHPLHPDVNGLHWGWQGGYVFMALEGHFPEKAGRTGGFSYHLAGEAALRTVIIEGALDLRRGGTIVLEFDPEEVLGDLDPAVDGNATHSRKGDVLAGRLADRIPQAFQLREVTPEIWQDPAVVSSPGNAPETARAAPQPAPWPLRISRRLPAVELPADNVPTRPGVQLGRRLFDETLLSGNGTQSCASCHQEAHAFTDAGKRVSAGAEGQSGTRNSMSLINLAWQKEFFWDGRTAGLRRQVLEPVQDPAEMHQSLEQAVAGLEAGAGYPEEFAAVFGSGGITAERIGLALEQFLLTLISQDSKFDQALLGKAGLTPQEQRGLELFITEHDPPRNLRGADCFHCHGGALFSNQGFANNGLDSEPEAGRQRASGRAEDTGKFRVPSLRNIAVTAPYMHDGRFATLEEVIDHYDHGVKRTATLDPNLAKHPAQGLQLSAEDKAALAAFLRTLTDPRFVPPPAGSPVMTTP